MKFSFTASMLMLTLQSSMSKADTLTDIFSRNLSGDDCPAEGSLEGAVRDLCQIAGCDCPCETENECEDKKIRLKEFATTGIDKFVSKINYNEEGEANDPFDGANFAIEVRFDLFNSNGYYPGNLAECGPGAIQLLELNDGENYCQIDFDETLNLDESSFIELPRPSGSWTIPFSMRESDNGPTEAYIASVNLSPHEWYDEDCVDYEIYVYKNYFNSGREICYVSKDGSSLGLSINECTGHSIPDDDFYTFVFEVVSMGHPTA